MAFGVKEDYMSAGDIYGKSQLGIQEVSNRKLKLAPRIRTMLILVDGQAPVFLLKEEAQKVGAAPDFLEQLEALGLIVKLGHISSQDTKNEELQENGTAEDFERFRSIKDFMNVSIVNSLGIKSFFFTLKLERASNLDELRSLIEPYKEAIAKGSGEAEAEVLTQRLVALLGQPR
jgi:hypothetical protein